MNALIAPRIARKAKIVTPIGRSFAINNHSFCTITTRENNKNVAKIDNKVHQCQKRTIFRYRVPVRKDGEQVKKRDGLGY